MKKTLIALAALGVVGAASAQVAVTGAFAGGIQKANPTAAVTTYYDADVTFSASEDLGGGLMIKGSSSIDLDAGRGGSADNNNTNLTFSGGMGSIAWDNLLSSAVKMGDVTNSSDMTAYMGGYTTRNLLTYTSPEIASGLKAQLQWVGATGNVALEPKTPAINVLYGSGPLSVYYSNGGVNKTWDVRATYDAGIAKVGLRGTQTKVQEVAITMPMGATTLFLSNAEDKTNSRKVTGFGATYAMSKQTSLQFGYATGDGNSLSGASYRLRLLKAF
jgi:hypothetical protein